MRKFKDDEEVGKDCPVCGKPLIFFMSFEDCFNHRTGHYTVDRPMIVCSDDDCEYQGEDYVSDEQREYEEEWERQNSGDSNE